MEAKKVRPCWSDQGLGPEGAERADKLLEKIGELTPEEAGVMRLVADELVFRSVELPRRTKEYQERYRKENA